LLREPQRVLGDGRLDALPHLRCRAEEPIRRRQSLERLVRALEVVVLDKQPHPPLAVLEVRKDGLREKLFPQRLPEPLDLPAGLRVVRPALDVRHSVALELRFELGRSAPRRVLPALIGQDLLRGSVVRDAARQRLQHQHTSLVMRHHEAN
jgi:hypothetical protein